MSLSSLKLHNAMWPGLVGKGDDEGQEPPISLEDMLDFSAAAEVDGRKFDGIDYFLFLPHTNPEASDDELKGIADLIQSKGFDIGSLVAPVWPGTVGDSAMGTDEQQEKFLDAVKMACRIGKVFNEHGARKGGVIRIDSAEFGVEKWKENPGEGTARIVDTFKKRLKLLRIMESAWLRRVKSAGLECTVGRICLTSWKEWECRKPSVFKPTLLTPTFTSWATMLPSTHFCRTAIPMRNFGPPTRR